MSRAWKVLERTIVYRAEPWFTVERQKVALPEGRVVADYHRIAMPDCAGVVARVEDGRYLLARHYRHGPGCVTLTLPGGGLNPGEPPLEAAQRELREETGYEAPHWRALGRFTMNANYGLGAVHFFAAEGAKRSATPAPGDLEDMDLVLLTRDELLAALRSGEVAVLAAATAILLATAEG